MSLTKIKFLSVAIAGCLLSFCVFTSGAVMADCSSSAGSSAQSQITQGIDCANGGQTVSTPGGTLNATISNIVNVLSVVVGIIAVVMLVVAGLRFASSAGSPEAVKGAKNTALYAIIGLLIVSVAQAVVHFVLHKIT